MFHNQFRSPCTVDDSSNSRSNNLCHQFEEMFKKKNACFIWNISFRRINRYALSSSFPLWKTETIFSQEKWWCIQFEILFFDKNAIIVNQFPSHMQINRKSIIITTLYNRCVRVNKEANWIKMSANWISEMSRKTFSQTCIPSAPTVNHVSSYVKKVFARRHAS